MSNLLWYWFVILVIAVLIIVSLFKLNYQNKGPPGPLAWPLFGNILSVGKAPHLLFSRWGEIYGSVFKVQMGELSCVILNDAETIKEAFSDPSFCGRLDNDAFNILTKGKNGVINSEPPIWNEQRKFMVRALRNHGFDNKKQMVELMRKDVEQFLTWLKVNEGTPLSIKRNLTISVFNSIWKIVSGETFKLNDKVISEIMDNFDRMASNLMRTGFVLFFPKLSKILSFISGWKVLLEGTNPLMNLFKRTIEKHENEFKENNIKDFIDLYILRIRRTRDVNSSFYSTPGQDLSRHPHLLATVSNLFSAATDTTSVTILWAILYIISFPEVQAKFNKEIDLVLGKAKFPMISDRALMPYTEAVILETLRMSTIAPIGLFHSTLKDVKFRGFTIPKQTVVIGNLYNALHDTNIWTNPEEFYPERFLAPDGKTFLKHDSFIPFSVGKRLCPGESIARNQIFIYLTSIFQRFTVSQDPINSNNNLESEFSFVLGPKPFKLLFYSR